MTSERISRALAAATFLLHAAVAGRYDFFRDELYFIVCGRHPAFGYADQPPLIPLLAAATQAFGESLVLLRLVPALAAAALVLVTCAFARRAGAGPFGAFVAGTAAAIAPMYLGLNTTLSTGTFEPLAWTLVALLAARAVLDGDARAWILAGAVVGLALQAKYAIPLYLVCLGASLVATGHGRALLRRELALGILLAAVLAAPSLIWQVTHGLPFRDLVRAGAAGKNVVLAPLAFTANQIVVMNPFFAPLWLAAVVAPWSDRRFARWRFLSVAFVLTFVLMIAMHAKDYYLAPVYAGMFAVGGAALERWVRSRAIRVVFLGAAVAMSAMAAPLAMPILDPPVLADYIRVLGADPTPTETRAQSELPQEFADMIGWRTYALQVRWAFQQLPAADRDKVALLTGNYGEAAAIDFYGPALGLPPAISGHNQYGFWGPRGHDGSVVLRINGDEKVWRPRCATLEVVHHFGAKYAMPYENNAPILLCRGLVTPLPELWPKLRHID
jgi:hypothetical protein